MASAVVEPACGGRAPAGDGPRELTDIAVRGNDARDQGYRPQLSSGVTGGRSGLRKDLGDPDRDVGQGRRPQHITGTQRAYFGVPVAVR